MKCRAALGSALAVLAFLSAACGSSESEEASVTQDGLTEITIAAPPGGVMPVDFRAGLAEGIFEKHGLKITVQDVATGPDAVAAAAQGGADLAFSDTFAAAGAISNGFDVAMVTPLCGLSSLNYFLVPADSGIKELADLRGKNIGIGAPPLFQTAAASRLDQAGIGIDDVQFTLVKDQTTFGAILKSGQVDAVNVTSSINANRWIAEYGFEVVGPYDLGDDAFGTQVAAAGWWATRDWYDGNEAVASTFTRANAEVAQWFADLPEEERAAYIKDQTTADLVALDKEIPGLLELVVNHPLTPVTGAVDTDALEEWITTGAKFAKVPSVSLDTLLFPSATEE
ncbi:hypothetical protein GCM10023350_03280 [Nocardioides endophyticus]|uniref:SsuA/THI5-like domain-containing protein n=2 Tax=Nocardioides endophyticus TaxID=1353775 RepID=A0ABP8YAL9_9ACTN